MRRHRMHDAEQAAILQMRDEPVLYRQYGDRGRKYTKADLSRSTLAARFEQVAADVLGSHSCANGEHSASLGSHQGLPV